MTLQHVLDGPADAEPVVLVHAIGTSSELWQPQLAALTQRYRVLRIDLPGHGGAPGGDRPWTIEQRALEVVGLLDELGLERVRYAGLSLGGAIGMALALAAPERLERLVLVSSSPTHGAAEVWLDRARRVRERGLEPLADESMERWFTWRLRQRAPETVARFRAILTSTPAEVYACAAEALAAWDVRERLAGVRTPTLVVVAAEDPSTTPEHGREIAARIPGARIVELREGAHLVNVERPEAFDRVLLAGLAGDVHARGLAVRREVLGDAHVDRAVASTTALTEGFQDLITRYAWGEVWARPGLEPRTRSVATLAVLTALGREDELAMHVRAARRNGLTPQEICEVLLHCAVYAGVPAANSALALARRVIEQDDA